MDDQSNTMEKASLLLETGRCDKAMELLLPVASSGDADEKEYAMILLIQACLIKDDIKSAISFAQKGMATGINSASFHAITGRAYYLAELYNQAIGHLHTALKTEPDNLLALSSLAALYLDREDYQVSETLTLKALSIAPDDADLHINLAILNYVQGKTNAVPELLDKALALEPNHPSALAIKAELDDRNEDKLARYKQLLALYPTNKQAIIRYRNLKSRFSDKLIWVAFAGATTLSTTLLLFPSLTDVAFPKNYFWLYLPFALLIGSRWRIAFAFFLINMLLLSQVDAKQWVDWPIYIVPLLAAKFSLFFYIGSRIIIRCKDSISGKMSSVKRHIKNETLTASIKENWEQLAHFDVSVMFISALSIYFAAKGIVPGGVGWLVLLPLTLLESFARKTTKLD